MTSLKSSSDAGKTKTVWNEDKEITVESKISVGVCLQNAEGDSISLPSEVSLEDLGDKKSLSVVMKND